jgi:3-methyl-2-oxobutanoate hydroxymethyltransferase
MNPVEVRSRWIEEAKKRKLVMLTAYDYPMARILDRAGVDMILVGDSVGMTVMGYPDTKSVTMGNMIHHVSAVARAVKRSFIVGDMPINSDNTPEDGLRNAKLLIDAGSHCVKLEGNKPDVINRIMKAGIPVMGHVGLLPQTAEAHKVQGKEPDQAEGISNEAIALDKLGVLSIVLESIPKRLARKITDSVEAPTIGIGAGVDCDGQVLVINDLLGFDETFKPKFVKRYAHLEALIGEAVKQFIDDVVNKRFPDEEHTYH